MRLIVFVIIVFFFGNFSFSQQDSLVVKQDASTLNIKQINEEDLTSYKNDKDFNYVEVVNEDSSIIKIKRWLRNLMTRIFEAIFGVGKASGIIFFVLRVLPYILLGILIFLLIKFFLKVNSRTIINGKQNASSVVFTEEENIIKNEDIQQLINEAIKQKNYRLAIRYSYLLVLKQLSEDQLISWEQQKTNEDYIKEIEKPIIKENFKTITRIYDYVWYGEFTVDAFKFEVLRPSFETITKSIKTN